MFLRTFTTRVTTWPALLRLSTCIARRHWAGTPTYSLGSIPRRVFCRIACRRPCTTSTTTCECNGTTTTKNVPCFCPMQRRASHRGTPTVAPPLSRSSRSGPSRSRSRHRDLLARYRWEVDASTHVRTPSAHFPSAPRHFHVV